MRGIVSCMLKQYPSLHSLLPYTEIFLIFIFSLSEQLELSIFAVRYMACLGLFILGFYAPGILSPPNYSSLNLQGVCLCCSLCTIFI